MWIRRCVPREDLDQERALAILEGRDPRLAIRAYIARERHFYDYIAGLYEDCEPVMSAAPMSVYGHPHRSSEGIARRTAYTREWWRRNGAEYRRRRKASQPGRTVDQPPVGEP